MNTTRATYVAISLLVALPMLAFAQTATTNNNPGNPLPSTQADDLETTAERIESSAAAQYQFKNEGIFGCNQVGGVNMSAGTMAAIGGVYVPVNDAAVTLNTGILVYKECVLRPLQDRLRESALSALLKQAVTAVETGRQGNKRYLVNYAQESLEVLDRTELTTLQGRAPQAIPAVYRPEVIRAEARDYRERSRAPETMLTCPLDIDLAAADSGNTQTPISGVLRMVYPSCYALGAKNQFSELSGARNAQAIADFDRMLSYGRGYYAVTDPAQDPLSERVVTPASAVQESFQQIIGSPVRQLEQANDIGQMIGALYAGITTHIISDNQGLAGIRQSSGGRPSYLEQVARESSQGVVGAAVNAALAILNPTREVEARYLNAMNSIAASLTQTINQLRGTERSCWNLIVPRVCAGPLAANNTCVAAIGPCSRDISTNVISCQVGGTSHVMKESDCQVGANNVITCTTNDIKLKVATSTAFSQQVIDSQVAPLATVAVQNVQSSERALGLIDQLIQSVTNTASLNAQRIALQQLDSLVAQKALHIQYDAVNAEKQREDVVTAMGNLVTDTAKAWGDSPDPSVGWCNINNPNVLQGWAERWRIKTPQFP